MLSRRASLGAIAGGATAGVALTGCRGPRRKVIAVVPKATSHIFWVFVQNGAIAAGKEFDVDILWNGPVLETDYARQIQIIDSVIAKRVDGIAVAATERKALVAPVDRAMAAGIPVTVFDSGLESTNYISYVATDNVDAGRIAARELAEFQLKGNGKVGLLMHAPGSASTMDREAGFTDTIEKQYPGVKIVATQYGMSDRAKARAAAENILTAHPDLNAMFASSEPSSVGAALALKARELTDKVSLVAFDWSDNMVEDLRGGAIDAMVIQDPYRMGFEAVRTLVDQLNGKAPPKRLDLNARLIRRQDLNDPQVKRLLNMR